VQSSSLESKFYSFRLRPDEGTWDLSAVGGGQIEQASLGARLRTQRGEIVWDGRLSGAKALDREKEQGCRGPARRAGLLLPRDGLELGVEFEACL
jgi:hypothetical protein